jgi:hypothetical protein
MNRESAYSRTASSSLERNRQTPFRRDSINHLDDAACAWVSDNDLFPNDDATIERGAITEWDLVVSDARIRQCVSDRHVLDLWIRLHIPSPHVSEECRFLISDDDDFGNLGANSSVQKMTGRIQRVAGAKRRRAGSHGGVEYFSLVGPGAHRCGSAARRRPPSGGSWAKTVRVDAILFRPAPQASARRAIFPPIGRE